MLLLLSLSSTEKQEAQNQFGLEVGRGERGQRCGPFLAVESDPCYATGDHFELGLDRCWAAL